jgi:hypothetical protein
MVFVVEKFRRDGENLQDPTSKIQRIFKFQIGGRVLECDARHGRILDPRQVAVGVQAGDEIGDVALGTEGNVIMQCGNGQ